MGLFNSTVLDWAIGIVFVYLLLAIICTTINEWIAGLAGTRAATLKKGIKQLLDDQKTDDGTFLEDFYKHPLISGMKLPRKTEVEGSLSYLSARTFATSVMDLATGKEIEGRINFTQLEGGVKKMPAGDVRTALLSLLQNANGDLNEAQRNIENWFDDTMERTSGWYKRHTQWVTILIAAGLTIATNADTVRIGELLWQNNTLRATIVEKAKVRAQKCQGATTECAAAQNPNTNDTSKSPETAAAKDELAALKPLLGWSGENFSAGWKEWLSRLLGWCLSITAISLGAPFWFDMLTKVMSIRNAGQKPEKGEDQDAKSGGGGGSNRGSSGGSSGNNSGD
jgi:hypothetical protein